MALPISRPLLKRMYCLHSGCIHRRVDWVFYLYSYSYSRASWGGGGAKGDCALLRGAQ